MNIRPFLRVAPRVRLYATARPAAGCLARVPMVVLVGALVWVFAIIGVRSLFGQVPVTTMLRDGNAELFVGNPAATPLRITLQLYRDATPKDGPVTLGDSVDALITPRAFTLAPSAIQTVRMRVRATVGPGELLRLVTTMDPLAPTDTAVVAPRAQLVYSLRLISKVQVVP